MPKYGDLEILRKKMYHATFEEDSDLQKGGK